MTLPIRINYRDLAPSEAITARIHARAAELERIYDRITSCRVAVELRHRHHHKGRLFHVGIELSVPGKDLVVSAEAHDQHQHEDAYVAVRDAFDAARRQLQDFARTRRDAKHASI